MKATFTVREIRYDADVLNRTLVYLSMGAVGSGDVGMGVSAMLELSGIEVIDGRVPRPGTLVTLTIEPTPTPGTTKGGAE